MKNQRKYYWIVWGIAVVIFHIIMFILPNVILSPEEGSFWIIYLTVMASFVGQAYCSYLYSKKENKQERFLYIPVVMIGYIALLMTFLLALQALTLQFLPNWFTIIVAILMVAYYAFAVLRALASAEMVIAVDKKVEQKMDFLKTLTAEAKALEQTVPTELRSFVTRVYESFRYSDPMSSETLNEIEQNITVTYGEFVIAIKESQKESAEVLAQTVCNLMKERNELCKQLKK